MLILESRVWEFCSDCGWLVAAVCMWQTIIIIMLVPALASLAHTCMHGFGSRASKSRV